MGIALIGPNRPMGIGAGRVALWGPLAKTAAQPGGQPASAALPAADALAGWWDASGLYGVLGSNGACPASWNVAVASVTDRSSNASGLLPFAAGTPNAPLIAPRLNGFLGGVGRPALASGTLAPDLDPDLGYSFQRDIFAASQSWTFYLVWSRPNRRQNSGKDGQPITLLTIRGVPILQADSQGGQNRLVLFPGSQDVVLSTTLSRRHTHSVVLRYTAPQGFDAWLDNSQVATSIPAQPPAMQGGNTLLLHDGTLQGAAQCWFHEAAGWSAALGATDIAMLLTYASRWTRGPRRGVLLLINGQSNAVNYALQDGAAQLLAQGTAWHTGALAYNVIATTGGQTSYTMQSGHGIYDVANGGYPGSFLQDPGDGSEPATWNVGQDGHAVGQAIAALTTEDREDVCALVWPWSETDSLRFYHEKATFSAAATRFLALERAMFGATADQLPLIWWNAIPYGIPEGMQMHREVVAALAADPAQNVWIGNPQTSDSEGRPGNTPHRAALDNQRFARLASPIVGRAIIAAGRADTVSQIPPGLPQKGGPAIVHAYRASATSIVLTVIHDAGTDLKVPPGAASGSGFAVMDGGSAEAPGAVVTATACTRVDATHLQLTLSQPLTNGSASCHLYYPYGSNSIGRGNAVTDNYGDLTKPPGWDIAADLGTAWALDFPLAATSSPIALSNSLQ